MKSMVHIICDYAPGDMAWAEVLSAINAVLPEEWHTHLTSVGSFETISTGFVLAQVALAEPPLRPENLIVFANCAPRKDLRHARANNEGEGLLYGTTRNNVGIIAVNSGYSMSFVRDELTQLWSIKVDHGGSQFRSRDNFPRIVGQAAKDDRSFLWHQLNPKEHIPDPPAESIAYVDSFGNFKTTFREGDEVLKKLTPGQRIKVTIGALIRTATVASGSFNVMEGDLAFAPGSSGHARRFWEIFQRGGSASASFAHPPVGSKITIAPAD
ncbi:MAG TPA: hypothetical protein V6D22_02115 [Candidatus Obscuribacterales bacterium]